MKNKIISNRSKLIGCGLAEYHQQGFDGRDKVIVVLDEQGYVRPDVMDKNIFSVPLGEGTKASHGTLVSQVLHIAAPGAKIVMLPFMNQEDRKASIKWIKGNKVDLINMSLNLATANSIYPDLKALNIPIIAAAGNDGPDTADVASPACYDWTIAVGGYLEGVNTLYYENSNGDNMDCVTYTSIDVETKPGYIVPVSGTSAASPWLCGMLASFFTGYSVPDVHKLREFIRENCIDLEIKGKDRMSGWGFFKLPALSERSTCPYLKKETKPEVKPAESTDTQKKQIKIEMDIGSKKALVNGKTVNLDCQPVVVDGRTLVPLRFIAENLECQVDYKGGKITVIRS